MTGVLSFIELPLSCEDVESGKQSSDGLREDLVNDVVTRPSESPQRVPDDDLLLREMSHRWSNDLQLVVGLLNLQSRRAVNVEVRQALADAAERVFILSHARKLMHRDQKNSLDAALKQVCDSLRMQAELRSICVSFGVGQEVRGISEHQVKILSLVVNELITNAIKHAFADRACGNIRVAIGMRGGREVAVTVDDDGRPLAKAAADDSGMGMHLVQQLMASIEGDVIFPPAGTKVFELRVPLRADAEPLTLRKQ